MQIRHRAPIDHTVFRPIDFSIPRLMTYRDTDGNTCFFKHIRAITPRNVGKSYGAIADAVERALEANADAAARGEKVKTGTFVYVRRGVEELDAAFPTILREVSWEFPGFEFRMKGRTWEAKPNGTPASEWRTVCYGIALAEAYKMRSTAWPDVELIIFDEYIDDGSRPLTNEETRFQSMYDTIARNRPVRTLFLANPQLLSPGVSNPYAVKDGLIIREDMPEFIKMRTKSVLYWFPRAGAFGNQQLTSRQKELGDSDYARMSTGGKFVNAMGIITGKKPKHSDPLAVLVSNGTEYSIWSGGDNDELFAERGAPKTEGVPWLALSPRDVRRGVRHASWGDPVLSAIREYWKVGAVVFQDTSLKEELELFMLR